MSMKNNQTFRTILIGGGIAGLAAAHALQEQARQENFPISLTLVEGENRLGGKIITNYEEGFTIEGGPDSFLRQKPWASELCKQTHIQNELMGTNDHHRKVYILNRGRLTPLPDGVMLIVPTSFTPFVFSPLFSIFAKLRMGMELLIPPYKGEEDESVASFVKRRLGGEALEKMAEPLMSGIHVSDPEKQSLLATFPRFRKLEQTHGNLIKGMLTERKLAAKRKKTSDGPNSIFITLKTGMGKMVQTLQESLREQEIITGQRVSKVEPGPKGWFVQLEDGRQLEGDALILAIPAFEAARLITGFASQLEEQLAAIRYVSTATVSLAFHKKDLNKKVSGFGFLAPKRERRKVTACTFTSFKFDHRAPQDMALLRCFVGGPGMEELVDLNDEELVQLVRNELREVLDIQAEPVLTRIFRWHKGNPQYDVDHLKRVERIHASCEEFPGLYVTGSAYEGIGIPDCIRQGQESAKQVFEYLSAISQVEPA
jgi:protoporphyrinogen/coproporphyrinogen III oxidase